ncbi:hypothetical protein ACQ4LE_006405, partial [Meloidogyne hapla]
MIASTSEQQSTNTSSFINNKTLFIKDDSEETNIKEAEREEEKKDKQNSTEQSKQVCFQFNIPTKEGETTKLETQNLIFNEEKNIKNEKEKEDKDESKEESTKITTLNSDCSSLLEKNSQPSSSNNLQHKPKQKRRLATKSTGNKILNPSLGNSETHEQNQQDNKTTTSSFDSLFDFLNQPAETTCKNTNVKTNTKTIKTSPPINTQQQQQTKTSISQQQFCQQLAELFSCGLQQLVSLGASASSASNIPNPFDSVSVEELGKMVLEQMCKEVGDQAYNIINGLTQQLVSQGKDQQQQQQPPFLQQPELTQNIISSLNNNFVEEQQQQKQFWQTLQQSFLNSVPFNNYTNTNDSGIFMDNDGGGDNNKETEQIKGDNNGQGMDCNFPLQQQQNSFIPFFENFFTQNQQTLPSNFSSDCLQRITTNNTGESFPQLVEMFAAFQCWQLLQQQQNNQTFSSETFPNTVLPSQYTPTVDINNQPTSTQTSTKTISESRHKRNNKERSNNKKQQNQNETQQFLLPQTFNSETQNVKHDNNNDVLFNNNNQTSGFNEQQQLIATQLLSQLFGQQQNIQTNIQQNNEHLDLQQNSQQNIQQIQQNIQQNNEYQGLQQNILQNEHQNTQQQNNQLASTLSLFVGQNFLPLFNGDEQQQEILKQMFEQQQNINNTICWKENKEENECQMNIEEKEENSEEYKNENGHNNMFINQTKQQKRLKKLSKTSNIQKVPPSSSSLNIPVTGALTVKSEKSLGALLLQNHDGLERIEELDELAEFSNCFKKQRIKHGFTQGDVGVALGKRYGTDFSQTTISRFEALNLSYKNMCKLRPLLEDWLHETDRLITAGASVQDIMEGVAVQRVAMLSTKSPSSSLTTNILTSVDRLPITSEQQDFTANISSISPIEEGEPHQHNHQITKMENDEKMTFSTIINNEPVQSKILLPPFKKRRKRTNLDTTQKLSLDTFFRIDPRPDNARMVEIASLLDLDHDVVRVWFCNRRQKLR